jgi:hypothetical protein
MFTDNKRRPADYDNDGWLDIHLLNGSTVLAMKGRNPATRHAASQ